MARFSSTGWREINPEVATKKAARLRDLLLQADDAVAAQRTVIEADGARLAWQMSLRALEADRDQLQRELFGLLRHREHETVEFTLEGQRYVDQYADLMVIGQISSALAELYVRIGQSTVGRPARHLPSALKRQFTMSARPSASQSTFGMTLLVQTDSDLLGDDPRRVALDRLLRLTNSADVSQSAAEHGTWAIKKYRDLVHTLIEAQAAPQLQWTTPYGEPQRWTASDSQLFTLENRLAQLREEEVSLHEVTGLLAEASLVRHTFGVSSDGRIIKGKVPAQLADAVQKAFGHQVVATYEERRVRDDVTQEERRSVSLLDVRTA
jgi:hypothetical protein